MDENVVNTEVKDTPQAETTPQETTETPSTDSGSVVKETQEKASDKLAPGHPRFEEVIKQRDEARQSGEDFKRKYYENLSRGQAPETETQEVDPYAGLEPDEAKQTRDFVQKYVLPEIDAKYRPFVDEFQTEKLNKQIGDAKDYASKFGVDFEERLPEIVNHLSRPENRGRLTAKEAFVSMYLDELTGKAKELGKSSVLKEQEELMEKKKQANTETQTVAPQAVVQSSEAAKANMSSEQRTTYDISRAIDAYKKGDRNPKVRV